MEFLEKLLPILFMVVIIPSIGVLTVFLVNFIQKKKEEIANRIDSELLRKYIYMLADTVTACVVATNQTYVNSLKEQGKFDKEAQKEAFRRTYEAVMGILSDEAVRYLTVFYGDLSVAVTTLIEEKVAEASNRVEEVE